MVDSWQRIADGGDRCLYSAREQTELIVGVGTARPPLRKTNGDGPSPPRPMGQLKAQTVAAPSLSVFICGFHVRKK